MWSIDTLSAVYAITLGVGVTATLIAWRERDEPGALPLMGMFVGQCLWVTFSLFDLQSTTFEGKLLWSELLWIGVVIIPVAWLLFSLEYTGRDQYVTPRFVLALSIVPAITVVLALTSRSHELLYTASELVVFRGETFLNRTIGPWIWVIMAYTYLLGVLGSIPLLDFIRSESRQFRGQSAAILLGTLAPWVSNALFLGGVISFPAFDPTPIAFLVSGVAYLGAVTQFQLFSTTPSASQHARRLFIDQLREGVIVVDDHGFVVDMNDSAREIFGVGTEQVLGERARDLFRRCETRDWEAFRAGQGTIQSPYTDTLYDMTRTEITDSHDRTVGTIISFHDIGDHVRNQQRHEVLNRLFRHNIRTQTNLIISHAELLESDGDLGDVAAITDGAYGIEETAEKARKILDLFERSRGHSAPSELSGLLAGCLGRTADRYPDATVECEPVPDGVYVDDILETVFLNILDNAVAHNDDPNPRVRVSVERLDGSVAIEFADDGPGIDEYERSVIERGSEDALQHGSGLGLWLIKWGTEIAGGEVSFRANEPSGTVLTVTVPESEQPEERPTDLERLIEP
ncbi:histidine kinase N-terminal 7TM domain-containing protein [Halorientalis halophila]|uniref:histidine kinase N-terminal 7TM domain-containing protein n=1 Tax=Halorientalis halophila TaxID=3108499 RepID=UPI00300B3E2C